MCDKPTPCEERLRTEVLRNLMKDESSRENYFTGGTQTIITEKMRMICVSWMCEVALEFKLLDQTLYLAVNYLDRYLAKKKDVAKDSLQLTAIVSLLLASKFNEIHPHPIKDFVWISANTYCAKTILIAEHKFLKVLEFRLHPPTVLDFVSAFVSILQIGTPFSFMANYFCDITLQEFVFHKYKPSVIALASIILALHLAEWPIEAISELEFYIEDLKDIADCCSDLHATHVKNFNEYTGITTSQNRRPNALKMKYRHSAVAMKPSEKAPSYTDICRSLNKIGLLSPLKVDEDIKFDPTLQHTD